MQDVCIILALAILLLTFFSTYVFHVRNTTSLNLKKKETENKRIKILGWFSRTVVRQVSTDRHHLHDLFHYDDSVARVDVGCPMGRSPQAQLVCESSGVLRLAKIL